MTDPRIPDPAYLTLLAEQMRQRAAAARVPTSPFLGAGPEASAGLAEALTSLRGELLDLSADIHAFAETAFEEHRSAARIAALLDAHGIDVERGIGGLETALRARIGPAGKGRVIGICAEYDALPGIGHACGHNVIAASGVGAFLALAAAYRQDPAALPGQVVLIGTPAEEGHTGKEHLARAGVFDELDAAIMLHPAGYDAAEVDWIGRRTLQATFTGVAAHASAQPFMGRNALDAASLAYQGIGLLRQQMLPIDRIHASLPEGGDRPSIITERARLDLYVRSLQPGTLLDLSARVDAILRGAALMAGCEVTIDWDTHPPSMPVRTNAALTGRWAAHQQQRGRAPLPAGVVDQSLAASTDFGNVSCLVPAIHPMLAIAEPAVALHTRAFAEAAASPAAATGVLDGAYGLAATALDYLCDDALAAAAADEFAAAGGVQRAADVFGTPLSAPDQ